MTRVGFYVLLIALSCAAHSAQKLVCTKDQQPLLVKTIDNWDIIATNTANIDLSPYFKGPDLEYSINYQTVKPKNKIQINENTGELVIVAGTQDNFAIYVTVKNPCGTAKGALNVQIDEEL